MSERKSVGPISIRLPERIYKIVEELKPAFNLEFTEVLVHIIKSYENSEDHVVQLDKIARIRYLAWLRSAQSKDKLEELEKGLNKVEDSPQV